MASNKEINEHHAWIRARIASDLRKAAFENRRNGHEEYAQQQEEDASKLERKQS